MQADTYALAEMSEEWRTRVMKVFTVMRVSEKYVVDQVNMFLCWKRLLESANNWNIRRTIPGKENT